MPFTSSVRLMNTLILVSSGRREPGTLKLREWRSRGLGRRGSWKHREPDSVFPAEHAGAQRRRLLSFFLGIQCGKPLARLRMRGVDFEKLGINGAYALRELHEHEQFSELNINRFLPRIEIDRLLEVLDGLLVILRYGPEAACQQGMVQSLFRRRFNGFAEPDNRANEVLRAQTFVSTLEPFFDGFRGSCLFSMHAKTAHRGQTFVVRGPFLHVPERLVGFRDYDHQVFERCNQLAVTHMVVWVQFAGQRVIAFLDLAARRFGCDSQELVVSGLASQFNQLPDFPLESKLSRLLPSRRNGKLRVCRLCVCGPWLCSRSDGGTLLGNLLPG